MLLDLSHKNVLVIGSGRDVVGRRLAPVIDSVRFDLVVRCNKPYGSPHDVGSRCDVAAVRYTNWLNRFGLRPTLGTLIFNGDSSDLAPLSSYHPFSQFGGWSEWEREQLKAEIGVKWPSCGALAVYWALLRGAKVSFLGFGYNPSTRSFSPQKLYPDNSPDHNSAYDWPRENAWLLSNATPL